MSPTKRQGSGGSPMSAVASEYGQVMVEHMRSQPRRVYFQAVAEFGTTWDGDDAKEKAEAWLERCERDKDYALVQAGAIARNVDSRDLGLVRSVEQVRHAVDEREIAATAWYDERGASYTPKTPPALTPAVVALPPWAGKGWKVWFDEQVAKVAKDVPEMTLPGGQAS